MNLYMMDEFYKIKSYSDKNYPDHRFIDIHGIKVYYNRTLNGGGSIQGPCYASYAENKFGNVNHVYEWCSGPGYIGFELLGRNLCNELTLADIHKPAIDTINITIQENSLTNVNVYHSNNLQSIDRHKKFDLIVGNPPHWQRKVDLLKWPERLYLDLDWQLHKNFYNDIHNFMHENSIISVIENAMTSDLSDWNIMIQNNKNLEFVDYGWLEGDNRILLNERQPFLYIVNTKYRV